MNRLLYILVLAFAASLTAQAQYTSRLGRFQVDQVKGCAPFTVTILNANLITSGECTAGKPCLMSAGNGSPQQQNQFTITYTQPGTFTLSILYQSIGADDITITVVPNIQPEYEIYSCSSNRVSIRITDKNYDDYLVDFNNDGSIESVVPNAFTQVASHNYGASGNYTISVRGINDNAANNCNANLKPFTAINTLPAPQITSLEALDATQLRLNYTPQPNIQYKLEIAVNNATTFQQFQTLYGVSTVTIPNLQVDNNFYCFRLGAFDPCTGTNVYSAPICSHNFDLAVQNGVNRLTWTNAAAGITSTEIKRNGTSYTTIPGAPGSFNDSDIVCKTQYCYQLVSHYAGAQSISLEKCGTAFSTSTPAAINNVSSVVSTEGVGLAWQQDPAFSASQYSILRNMNGGSFAAQGTSAAPQFTDDTYTTEGNFCYQINYLDECDNISQPGALVCPMRLAATLDNKNVITLRWTALEGWRSGVFRYIVQKYDRSGGLMETINAGTDTEYIDEEQDFVNQVVQYRVIAEPNEPGLINSISNQLVVTKEANLFYPNAFTPDGTGPVENETFSVSGQFIVKMELKIFDRWGSLIFYTDKNEPWNGNQGSRAMPEGTYVWTARITDLAGREFNREGTVVILKKKN